MAEAMARPKISVLMPVYNAEKFLKDAIESVLNQSFTDFEFIIIDDGSTDSSKCIVNSFADQRIRFFENDGNLGITATLNRGIGLARAEYIARMDADDICYTDRLQRQYAFIEAHPDGALYSCWAMEVTEGRKPLKVERHPPEHYYFNLTFACWIYHPTMVYRKDAVLSVGGYTTPYSEDFELIWQLSRRYKMYHLPEVLLEYRLTNQSLWQFTKKNENKEFFLKQLHRNISYYLGTKDFHLEDWQLEFLSFTFSLPPKKYPIKKIMAGVRLLDFITAKMLCKANNNLVPSNVKNAHHAKRNYTLSKFANQLGYFRGTLLLIRMGSWDLLWNRLKGFAIAKIFIGKGSK